MVGALKSLLHTQTRRDWCTGLCIKAQDKVENISKRLGVDQQVMSSPGQVGKDILPVSGSMNYNFSGFSLYGTVSCSRGRAKEGVEMKHGASKVV